MKKYIIFFLLACSIVVSCLNNDQIRIYEIPAGNYWGNCEYKGIKYWAGIAFDSTGYEEFPSGGYIPQRDMSCLTIGRYFINKNKLTFIADSFKIHVTGYTCTAENALQLPGEYKIVNILDTDSLIFSRGFDEFKVTYHLRRKHW